VPYLSLPSPGAATTSGRDTAPEAKPTRHNRADDPVMKAFDPAAGGGRLLIVDDNVEMLTLVSQMAACLGYAASTATSGKEALHRLQKGDVDLVLTDYQMPLMDGFQLAFKIRHQYAGLPVILMTGYYCQDLDDRIQTQGLFDGLLQKPFNLNTLEAKLNRAVASSRESCTA
jgi:two-component system, NarL family, capsular synthesis sensor histidine kinase RcsC